MGEIRQEKKVFLSKRKKKGTLTPLSSLVPLFPKAPCSAMRFLKSPTRVLLMLLPGANEMRIVSRYIILEMGGWVSMKRAPSSAGKASGDSCDGGWWISTPRYFKDEWQPSAQSLWFDTSFFFFSQQTSVSDEWLRIALTFHCFGLTVCIAMQAPHPPPFHSPKTGLTAELWGQLECFFLFCLFFTVLHTHAHTHTHIQIVG